MDKRWILVALGFGMAAVLAFANGCAPVECFRDVRCVTACGAPPVKDSCEGCDEGTFDDIACRADAGTPDGG